MSEIVTIQEAAKILDVNPETLRRWDKNGKFKGFRHPINNYRVYKREDVYGLRTKMNGSVKSKESTYITPFFNTQYGHLYKGDVLEVLSTIESESVDLVFADPPYNIKKAKWDVFSSQDEYLDWCLSWIEECHRILKPNGTIYICGFSEILADIKWISKHLFFSCRWLVWFYRNKANLGKDWGRSHESILVLRKSKDFIFNIDEVRIPYNEHTTKYPKRTQAASSQYSQGTIPYEWEPNPLGAKPKDVLEIPTISNGAWEKFPHATQKPVELLRKVILSSSNSDSVILDPFGGSGTTYAVSEAYSRKWIGIEREEEYCKVILERLSDKRHLERIFSSQDEIESQKRRLQLRENR